MHSALAVPARNALCAEFISALKHGAAPVFRYYARAVPFTSAEIKHAELYHILAAYVKTGRAHSVTQRAGGPCVFTEAHYVHERGTQKFEQRDPADLFDGERNEIERRVRVLPLNALLVGERLRKHHREGVVGRVKRGVVYVDVKQTA